MPIFVIQIQTSCEPDFIKQCHLYSGLEKFNIHWLRRILKIRKKGILKESINSIYPGYLFLEIPQISTEIYTYLKRCKGFIRFLKDNHDIRSLSDRDLQLINHFLSHGDVLGISQIKFDKNQKVVVLKGPLMGLEGRIIKVDKRKKRIKVKLEMYENQFLVDFAFDDISGKQTE